MDEHTSEPVFALGTDTPVDHVESSGPREKATDAWHRELHDGRTEIMCRAEGFRIRVSAPEEQAWEAVEMFERWTGLSIHSEKRPRRKMQPPPGQLDLLAMTELESEGNDG